MTDTDTLNQMIKDTARSIPRNDEYGNLCVELRESRTNGSAVTIRHLPADAIVIKVDEFPSPDSVFKGEKGECKRADYAIISEERKCIIYIEIKSTTDKWGDIVNQLKGAQCFIGYCREIGKAFWNSEILKNYKHRFINIRHIRGSNNKKETRANIKNGKYDTPDKAWKMNWQKDIQFNHLAGLGR